MENRNKEVKLGPKKVIIPNDWEIKTLGKADGVCKIVTGGTPSTRNEKYWNGNINWVTPTDITKNGNVEISKSDRKITKKGLKNSSAKLLPIGSILLTTRATIGEASINTVPMATNQGFKNLICKEDVDNLFLYYMMQIEKKRLSSLGGGSTFNEISKRDVSGFEILVPPLPEQRRIAGILSTVDDAIRKTDRVIEKAQRLKKGLMQDLLTRGIGHTRFKEVPIGPKTVEVPEEWDVVRLEDVAAKIIVPQRDKPKSFDGNIPWIRIEDLDGMYLSDSKSGRRVSKRTIEKMNLKPYPVGTVLCSCSGNMGVCAITQKVLTSNQTFAGIVVDKSLINIYLYYYLIYFSKTLQTLSTGTTIKYLSKSEFKKFHIALPNRIEQEIIVKNLTNIDSKIQSEKQYKQQLQKLKKGLMQDLLTGKVRVNT